MRAAANSIANGSASTRAQISATTASSSSPTARSGAATSARSTNRRAAASAPSGGSGRTASPGTPSASRLVANTTRSGHASRSSYTALAAASTTCSQLSSTSRWGEPAIASMTRSSVDNPAAAAGVSPAEIPSSDAIAGITESGSVNGANSTNVTEHVFGAPGELGRDRRLAGPARTEQRHQPCPGELLAEVGEHVVTADDRRQAVRDAPDPARGRACASVRPTARPGRSDGSWARIRCSSSRSSGPGSSPSSSPNTPRAVWNVRSASTLATLAVLGRHQQRPPVLVDRFGDDERFELAARRVEVLVGLQLDLEPAGPRRTCHAFEANALAAAEVGVGDVVVRAAAHERLSRTQQATRFGRVSVDVRRRPSQQILELLDVDRVVGDGEQVAPTVGLDLGRGDVPAQPRHLRLDRVRRGWATRPQDVGQPLGRHGCRSGGDQRREQPPLLHAARRHVDAVAVTDDKWTEDFESHRSVTLRERDPNRHRLWRVTRPALHASFSTKPSSWRRLRHS